MTSDTTQITIIIISNVIIIHKNINILFAHATGTTQGNPTTWRTVNPTVKMQKKSSKIVKLHNYAQKHVQSVCCKMFFRFALPVATASSSPVHRSTVGSRAFSVAGPQVWNCLPPKVTSAPSLATFRTRLKTILFTKL